MHVFFSLNTSIFVDVGYDWYFIFTSFKLLRNETSYKIPFISEINKRIRTKNMIYHYLQINFGHQISCNSYLCGTSYDLRYLSRHNLSRNIYIYISRNIYIYISRKVLSTLRTSVALSFSTWTINCRANRKSLITD